MTAIAKRLANANTRSVDVVRSRDFLERQAFEAFKSFVLAFQDLVRDGSELTLARPTPSKPVANSDVMTADDAAIFLGVDRNTVYEYATRGVIPHQRLGKRILFRRGALVAWLDSSLCAANSKVSR